MAETKRLPTIRHQARQQLPVVGHQQISLFGHFQFIASGHSYESYLRAYEVEESKGCFPYEWFDSAKKLEHTTLPPHKAFYSTLKAQNINAEKYQECLAVWKKEHMNTFRDFLVYYNNKDVIGFLQALKKQTAFFQRQRNDVFG